MDGQQMMPNGQQMMPGAQMAPDGQQMEFNPEAFFPIVTKTLKKAGFYEQMFYLGDIDFGFREPPERRKGRQFSVRVILRDGAGKICVVHSLKKGYIQIPGGGIEPGETIEQAVRRETREETGFEIEDIRPVGYGNELMFGGWERWVYVFEARAANFVGTAYTPDEIEEEFEPVWMEPDTALGILEVGEQNLANMPPEKRSYRGAFANRRDLLILQQLSGVLERNATRRKYKVVKILGLVIVGLIVVGLIAMVLVLMLPKPVAEE